MSDIRCLLCNKLLAELVFENEKVMHNMSTNLLETDFKDSDILIEIKCARCRKFNLIYVGDELDKDGIG